MIKMREGVAAAALFDLVDFSGVESATLVEVGSYAGESAALFASMDKISKVFCVDPWKPGYDPIDIASSSDFVEVESEFDKVVERSNGKIVKFKGDFVEFASKYQELVPDIVYIDAKHDYDSVSKDIRTSIAMNARIISGHDYNSKDWPGVVMAVNNAFGSPDKVFRDTSWIKTMK